MSSRRVPCQPWMAGAPIVASRRVLLSGVQITMLDNVNPLVPSTAELVAFQYRAGQLRSYRVDRIAGVRPTAMPFMPRFVVEF
jgi:hypothetical protein